MEGGDVYEKEEGRQWGSLRGSYRDRSVYARGTLEDEGALPPCEERRDPVDNVRRYVLREEEGPQLGCINVVKAGLYVEEEGGYLQKGPLKGSDFMGEGGHPVRGAEAQKGAALVRVKQAGLPC